MNLINRFFKLFVDLHHLNLVLNYLSCQMLSKKKIKDFCGEKAVFCGKHVP